MLTKEEYEEAYENLYNSICELEEIKSGVETTCVFDDSLDCFKELIEEHFSNPPLKWEEIKEHDFVFDKDFNGLGGEWLKVYMKHITNYGEKVLTCGACGSDEAQTRSYKEDRFYRKEVQE